MAVEYLQSSPRTSQQKEWIVVNSNRNVNDNKELSVSKTATKLLFNEAVPACSSNRATCVDLPTSIVIEKLLPVSEERNLPDSTKSSISFTTLSEERLSAAVKLAKRDLRRRRLDSLNKSPQKHTQKACFLETSEVELLQNLEATPNKVKLKASSPKEQVAKPRGRLGCISHNRSTTSLPHSGQSPPTREHADESNPLDNEIHKLQHELEVCIQKAEELACREQKLLEPLEPEELSKLDIRKQKQAARSSSIIYALQQQVKELQENLQQGQSQKTRSATLQRLAAVHRGALRALNGFIQQLSDTTHSRNVPNFNNLSELIRQLCLCSAKVEVNKGSAVPQSAISILQKLKTLDSALSKQALLKKMQVLTCPSTRKSLRSSSITESQGFVLQAASKPKDAAKNIKGKRKSSRKLKSVSYALAHRRDVLRAGVERLAQQREQGNKDIVPVNNSTQNESGVYPEKVTPLMKVHSSSFLEPTISSRLRVIPRPQRQQSVPWIPTSPHSPPRQRPDPLKTRLERRCLFPPEKSPQRPPKAKFTNEAKLSLNSEKKQPAQEEAMRRVWLDKMKMQRRKEHQQLGDEETQHLHILRSNVISPTRCAEEAEQKAPENMLPHLDQAQSAESTEQLSEALLEDKLEDTAQVALAVETDIQLEDNAQRWTQTSTLENMLLRMEEIQRDQEEVRRRVTSITYSDPLYWNRSKDTGKDCGSRPCSPQPIRLTKPVLRQHPMAEIILEKPLETGVLLETRQTEVEVSELRSMFPPTVKRSRGAVLSVPSHMLRNIRQYRDDYEAYCHSVALKTTGGVTPWAIVDSLAEELLVEALTVVAAEFQDVLEEYAEAVFTSEFLQPVQSPAPSAQAITQ